MIEKLWDDRLGFFTMRVWWGLVIVPVFALGTFLMLMNIPYWTTLANLSIALSFSYIVQITGTWVIRRSSRYFWNTLRRAVRSEMRTQGFNKMNLDKRFENIYKELDNIESLTDEERAIMRIFVRIVEKILHDE